MKLRDEIRTLVIAAIVEPDRLTWAVDELKELIDKRASIYAAEQTETLSECCGAPIVFGDICTQCNEHI